MNDKGFLIGILIIGILVGMSCTPFFEKIIGAEDTYELTCIEGHQYIYKTLYHRAALAPAFDDEGYPVKCSMKGE